MEIEEPQRTEEWLLLDEDNINYHLKQLTKVYRMTEIFYQYIFEYIDKSKFVMDLGCGAGANTVYAAEKFKEVQFHGIDLNKDIIDIAILNLSKCNIPNVTFSVGDIYNLRHNKTKKVDGILLHQTISWLPDFEKPLLALINEINPKWIAMSGLFYEGAISVKSEVYEHRKSKKSFYNTYSVHCINAFAQENKYKLSRFNKYLIDIDIKKPRDIDIMGTYTVDIMPDFSEKLQISGPLLMNWGFVVLERML